MSIAVTARDVPEIRARMASWARDPGADGAANWFTFFLGPHPDHVTESRVFDRADNVAAIIAGTMAAQLPVADLFFVSADMTDLARHAADTLTDYRLHPEDLPAPVGLMLYAHPPVERTANEDGDGITMVSWGPGRGGLWVHTWAAVTESWTNGFARLGRTLAEVPHETLLARATRVAEHAPDDLTPPTSAEEAADWFLAGLLPKLRRAPIPPSVSPTHGYHWRGLTPMEFTDMQGWPIGVPDSKATLDAKTVEALERTILATWLLMGQTLVRSERVVAQRPSRRRIARADPKLDPRVRYIDLRRARTERADRTDEHRGSGRAYRHRWIVRGLNRTIHRVTTRLHLSPWLSPLRVSQEDLEKRVVRACRRSGRAGRCDWGDEHLARSGRDRPRLGSRVCGRDIGPHQP